MLGGACAILATGCALGYGVGHTTAKAGPTADPRAGFAADQAFTMGTFYQELRVIDTTGLVLAALVNTGRQYNARNDALEAARDQPADADGKVRVEYSWEPMPILAGLLTDLRIRLPLGTPTLEGTERTDLSYWAFEVRPEFYTFRPVKRLPMVTSLYLTVQAENWNHDTLEPDDFDLFMLDMDVGASTSYVLGRNLTATGRLGVGFLSPLTGALAGGPLFTPSAEVEVGWRPWASDKLGVQVSGIGYLGRETGFDRSVWGPRLGVNVAFTVGNQVPKKVRQAAPAASADPATVSGGVCLGDAPAPECKDIMTGAPDAVQVLFTACAQATINAADSRSFDTQPGVCRTAARGIHGFLRANAASLDDASLRAGYAAAAAAYDFAALGYELGSGRHTADHCAMIEGTFAGVIGPEGDRPVLASKVGLVDAQVSACRARYTCRQTDDGEQVCEPK